MARVTNPRERVPGEGVGRGCQGRGPRVQWFVDQRLMTLLDDIFLDSETLDSLQDPQVTQLPAEQRLNALRFGMAVTYDDMYGWRTWTQSLATLLWTHLTMPDARVVGWDILDHDLPVIRRSAQAT